MILSIWVVESQVGLLGGMLTGCWWHGLCLRMPGMLLTSTSRVLKYQGLKQVLINSFFQRGREVGLAM